MHPIKQYPKVKKSEKSEKILFYFDYLILQRIKSGNLLQENVCDVDVIDFKRILNISNKKLYTSNIIFLFNKLSIKKFGRLLCLIQ